MKAQYLLASLCLPGALSAATVGIGDVGTDANNFATFTPSTTILSSVTVGGQAYTTAQLVQGTVTSFVGDGTGSLLITRGGGAASVDTAQKRRDLLETDWDASTGIINPQNSNQNFGFTFNSAIVNNAGADFVMFEIDNGTSGDDFDIEINGITLQFSAISGGGWGDTGVISNSSIFDVSPAPGNLTDLLNNGGSVRSGNAVAQPVWGTGIDLSDFGVADGASITSFTFDGRGTDLIDPVIIAGLQAVPEPSSSFLLLTACGALLLKRRR